MLEDIPTLATVATLAPPSHIAISSDSLTLAVCVERQALLFALMYDVRAFAEQVIGMLTSLMGIQWVSTGKDEK